MVRRRHVRQCTLELLSKLRINKPPVPVDRIAEALGARIESHSAEDSLSGFLLRDPSQREVLIGVNSEHSPNRRRFTIAHECGHLVLHQLQQIHVDAKGTMLLQWRDEKSATGSDMEEMEANLFAAELLMPEPFVAAEVAKFRSLDESAVKHLAKSFGVSSQAMAIRLAYLNYQIALHE